MRIALFGGTFDPIHHGHLAVARAARERMSLDAVHFIPADRPPHKLDLAITPYEHRFAMLDLALANEANFFPSRIEELLEGRTPQPNFTIDTVKKFKEQMDASDQLFLIIGIDTFFQLATWREPAALSRECDFIVVSRPAFASALLEPYLAGLDRAGIKIERGRVHLLDGVAVPVSATVIRQAARAGAPLNEFVPPAVADFIREHHLYAAQ